MNKSKKTPAFKPFTIKLEKTDDIFILYRLELAIKVTKAVLYCIKYNMPKLIFAEVIIGSTQEILSLNVTENTFLENLDKNLIILEEYEEYELCAEIVKAREKILKGLPKKSTRKQKDEAVENLISTIKNL
jgi:hypothetical protein